MAWKKTLFVSLLLVVLLCTFDQADAFWWGRRRRRRSPPPPPAPRFSYCPSSMTNTTDNANGRRVVAYSIPRAPGFTVRRTCGPASGSVFDEGVHTITHEARNSAGQRAYCTFKVTVTVLRCPNIPSSSHRMFSCTKSVISGSECTFSCRHGYRLVGSNSLTCQNNERWTNDFPTCQARTCSPRQTSIPDGNVSCSDSNLFGSVCTFACNRGFGFQPGDTATRTCGSTWSGSVPTCIELSCPPLAAPPHGRFRQPCDNTFGSWCYLVCEEGYSVAGSASRRCTESETWDGTPTECRINMCQKLTPGPGLQVVPVYTCPAGNSVPYNSICCYTCEDGHIMHGASALVCGADGSWLQTLPVCQEITCSSNDLPAPVNGMKSGCSGQRIPYGTTCTLSCNHGYTPTTTTQRTCQRDISNLGVWSGGTITCTAVTCPPLANPPNGFISTCVRNGQESAVRDRQQFDTACTVACDSGYTLRGTNTLTCVVSGAWTGTSLECTDETNPVVQCPLDQVIFAGEGQSRVSISWQWEPVMARDAGSDIPAILQSIDSNPFSAPRPTSLGEGIHLLVYSATDASGNTGSCVMRIEAKVARCPGLNAPTNGAIQLVAGQGSCAQGAVHGSQCEITCSVGHVLSTGGATLRRQCNRTSDQSSQGYWSLEQPTCEANSCPHPVIANGYITGCQGSAASYGESCEFRCDPGRRSASGHTRLSRECQADGSWSGTDFQCTEMVTCPGPFSVTNGSVEPALCRQDRALPYGTVCRFSCANGFRLQGPTNNTCSATGAWDNPHSTVCLDTQSPSFDSSCPLSVVERSDNGSTSAIVNFDAPTATDNSGSVTVNRRSGHPAPGSRFPEGMTTVTFYAIDPSGNTAHCDVTVTVTVNRCQMLSAPAFGSIRCSFASPVVGTECNFTCNRGYTLSGSTTATCRLTGNGMRSWDGQTPACTIVQCPSQPTPPNAVQLGCSSDLSSAETFGTECFFYCQSGYRALSSDGGRARCLENGTWSGTDLVCTETECPTLSPRDRVTLTPAACNNRPVFGQNCYLSCPGSGYEIDPRGSDYITCLNNGDWSRNISNTTCVDWQEPRWATRPPIVIVHLEIGQTAAHVNWNITATDNSGTPPSVTCSPGPGQFYRGDHLVMCTATDTAGNQALHHFEVKVQGWYTHKENTQSDRSSYKRILTVAINPLYYLVSCDSLMLPNGMQVVPQICAFGSPPAGTLCTVLCLYGFVPSGGSVLSVRCGQQGLWEGGLANLPTSCEDQAAPFLTYCPGPVYANLTDPAGALVSFDTPTAQDNGLPGTLSLVISPPNITSPYLFTESTVVSFTFIDTANNSVTCMFSVHLLDEREPEVIFCPSDGYRVIAVARITEFTWEEPRFRDPSGDNLLITNNRGQGNTFDFPVGTHMVIYVALDPDSGKVATCQFTVVVEYAPCLPLNTPANGALACDSLGRFCAFHCNDQFMVLRTSSHEPGDDFECRPDGTWHPPADELPDCSETRNPFLTDLKANLKYFTGDCTNQSTMESIAAAFIMVLEDSGSLEECNQHINCTVQNVQVHCGPRSRRRRSVDLPQRGDVHRGRWQRSAHAPPTGSRRRRRRTTVSWEATISFDIRAPFLPATNVSSRAVVLEAEAAMMRAADRLFYRMLNGSIPPLQVPGLDVELDETSLGYRYAEVLCEQGYIPDNDAYVCAACTAGTMYNASTVECQLCPRGSYQEEQAQLTCIPCPPGTTTAAEGTKNATSCREICSAGRFSDNGITPCTRCMMGRYQAQRGQTSCQTCPEGTTTLDFGAQSVDQCLELCPPGSMSDTGLAPCRPCEHRTYQPRSQQRHCIVCPGNGTTLGEGSTSVDQCIDVNECESSPCPQEAACVDLIDGYRCECLPGYEGVTCQNVDDCRNHLCINGATCTDGLMSYVCVCDPAYEGTHCEINVDECVSAPCQNGGSCLDGIGEYLCQCAPDYHGIHCEQERTSCSPSPCQNGGTCEVVGARYQCRCSPGFSGTDCEVDIDECISNPCFNGGTCNDLPNGYSCTCLAGYTGRLCQTVIDWCAESPCHEGATCVDQGRFFRCVCPQHRSGPLCDRTPCQNSGLFLEGLTELYTCRCPAGYEGQNCEIDVDECASGPCSNGATCRQHQVNAFMCECPPGFQGDLCTIDINECASSPCGNGSACEDDINGYTCLCGPGMTGARCQDPVDFCVQSACQHGATCLSIGTGYQCLCGAGFTGPDCQLDVNECLSGPCMNGGSCANHVGGFTCTCLGDYVGSLCEVHRSDCSFDCQNGGTCLDGVTGFYCVCLNGFTGAHCQVNLLNSCSSQPCQHQGTCLAGPSGYQCQCLPGYTGPNCEVDVDHCASVPCLHATACLDGVATYTCFCESGFSGANCDVDIDECASRPCLHGGVCQDLVAGFFCLCPEGFNGTLCQGIVPHCGGDPCFNGGVCVDVNDTFRCLCNQGSTGQFCEINLDDCNPDPCLNGAKCSDGLNAYTCQCLPGYSGANCELEINECQQSNVQCQHGGSCVDKVGDFECSCVAGYGGRYCEAETDECESNPCQNGGSCQDEFASFSCDCPLGFTGAQCDIEVNLCLNGPCRNGASCIPRAGNFTCVCPAGLSGSLCDSEIDECSSQPCRNQGRCIDQMNGYQCECLPGYTGTHCGGEYSTDFDLKFSSPVSGTDLVRAVNLTSGHLPELSALLWLRSSNCHGDLTLLLLSVPGGPSIRLSRPSNLTLTFLGFSLNSFHQTPASGMASTLCDGRWHSVLLTWRALGPRQEWATYVDQSLASEGSLSTSSLGLPAGLSLIIGPQTEDAVDDGVEPFELELSGVNIWSRALSEAEIADIASSCRPTSSLADVFAWGQILIIASDGITHTLKTPSECDDFDECSSNPCLAGLCEDRVKGFACHCYPGWEGDQCQTKVDYCRPDSCLNRGECRSENISYSCSCPRGFSGKRCELEVVNGGWGPWSPFSDCSKTCGGGRQYRIRTCDSPQPLNGGRACPGEDQQLLPCNNGSCPTCINLRPPLKGVLHCNRTESNESRCQIACKPGYAFDREPYKDYQCGKSTSYAWNHQSVGNPYAKLPSCVEAMNPIGTAAAVTANLSQVTCNSASQQDAISMSISQNPAVTNRDCVADRSCSFRVNVANCKYSTGRAPRQTESNVQIQIAFFTNTTGNSSGPGGGDENDVTLQAAETLRTLMQVGGFMLEVKGQVVQPDPDSVELDWGSICPNGSVESPGGYCVRCGPGTFLFESQVEQDTECQPCPANTYQDQEGQRQCKACPGGMATDGKGASSTSECYTQCNAGMYRVRGDVITDSHCELCPRNTYSPTRGMDFCLLCPPDTVTKETGASRETACQEPVASTEIPTQTTPPDGPNDSLSAIIGVSVAVIVLAVFITGFCWYYIARRRPDVSQRSQQPTIPLNSVEHNYANVRE
ncbi:sushi, von Willebrand factor type A, EGF and pentraxin domain-containing protein 1-like [Acanthaster planci]|uniref:Sushi, von Willebrand factor type A, EGF and pentraxin domain-containing protein 1-like n=1 Tax=Acanthaster planci TaxID=133434 RepID=A0A8B7XRM7_ACAPL|nr:sushi, von Willebrand factor type A, EGF and pentraxin domain-containing protein 1-like [Acanthaster planci]